MIETQPAPCWRLVLPDGTDYDEGEGAAHHDTEKDAAEQAVAVADRHWPQPGPAVTPQQWEQPCALVSCDGCGADPDDDVWGHIHFPDEQTARAMASAYDYRVEPDGAGGKVWCETCADDRDFGAVEQ